MKLPDVFKETIRSKDGKHLLVVTFTLESASGWKAVYGRQGSSLHIWRRKCG